MLADRGFLALALDMRGQGGSDWAPDGDYSLAAYADDLAHVVEAIGGRAALVGSSLGGLAALAGAHRIADGVTALILADITPRHTGSGGEAILSVMSTARTGFADVDEAGRAISRLMGTPPRASNEGLREQLRPESGRLYWSWDPRVIEERFVRTPAVIDALENAARELAMPTLLIHAERSEVVTIADVARFAALVPNIAVRTLAGARHMVTGDSNHAYGMMIVEFLASSAA